MARRWVAVLVALPLLYLGTPHPVLAGTITRCTKTSAGGGTAFVDNTTIEASEVNCDFDALFNLVNGSLDGDNISGLPWSDITGSRNPEDIDDTSATSTEMEADKDPGDVSSRNLPTDLEDELQSLRYAIQQLAIGRGMVRRDATPANVAVPWFELPVRGPNVVPNGTLDIYTGDSSSQDPPDAWSKAATPTTLAPVSLSVAEGEGQAIHIVADAASEGIEQTVDGLKADTRYLLQVKAKVASGTFSITTTGSTGTDWDDLDITASGATYDVYGGVILTDATPTDLQIHLLSDASGDDFTIAYATLRELSDNPLTVDPGVSSAMFASAEKDGEQTVGTNTTIDDASGAGSTLQAQVIVPVYGTWRVRVSGMVSTTSNTGSVGVLLTQTGAATRFYPIADHTCGNCAADMTTGYEVIVFPATNGGTYTFGMEADGSGTAPQVRGTAAAGSAPADGEATTINAYVERVW